MVIATNIEDGYGYGVTLMTECFAKDSWFIIIFSHKFIVGEPEIQKFRPDRSHFLLSAYCFTVTLLKAPN